MTISTQPHMRVETFATGEVPVPCDCALGYHHRPDAEPLIEHDENGAVITRPGRHPYCVGACTVWGTPTEEFDFTFVTGHRLSQDRVSIGMRVTDRTNPHGVAVAWDNDPVATCAMLGVIRLATWKRTHQSIDPTGGP